MIYELNHFGIMVSDIHASLAFYKKLDARVVFEHTTERGVDLRYLQIAGGMIELVGIPSALAPADLKHGIDHLAFMTDSLDEDYQRLIDAGCTADGGTKPAASGRGHLGFLRRPGGAKLELLQREEEFRLPEAETGLVTAFDHYAYQVEDIDEATTFFAAAVGMTPLHEMTGSEGNRIRSFLHLGYDVLGLRADASTAGTPFPHFALRVENIDRTAEVLETRGLSFTEPPVASRSGSGKSALLIDPDGVRIEFLDRPDLRAL